MRGSARAIGIAHSADVARYGLRPVTPARRGGRRGPNARQELQYVAPGVPELRFVAPCEAARRGGLWPERDVAQARDGRSQRVPDGVAALPPGLARERAAPVLQLVRPSWADPRMRRPRLQSSSKWQEHWQPKLHYTGPSS